MVSYLDVVTILLVFFIAAAAKTLSATKPEPVHPAPVPAIAPAPPRDLLREQIEAAGIEVRREPQGLVASLPQAILFSPGDDRVNNDALPLIGGLAGILRDVPNHLIVVGHADATPIHNRRFRNNWELSVARSTRVLELLSGKYQIDESRMSISADGSNHPAGANDTPEGRARNRRVEIFVLDAPETPRSN